jgi:TatD DNase family protein
MQLIDSHCHLEAEDFRGPDGADERPAVLARAAEAGVCQMVVIGSGKGLGEVRNAVALSREHEHLFSAVGVHPHDACAIFPPDGEGEVPEGAALWEEIERLAHEEARVVAVGETGLDFHYDHSTPGQQRALLRRTLGLARACGKPVVLHIREAHEEVRALVREAGIGRGVVHCFTGTAADAEAWLGMGFYISLSGIVTFKSAGQIREAAVRVPADRLLLETDCPYLAPVPLRGKRNEPAYLVHTAAFVAKLRGVGVDELAAQTTAAARALFGLPAR